MEKPLVLINSLEPVTHPAPVNSLQNRAPYQVYRYTSFYPGLNAWSLTLLSQLKLSISLPLWPLKFMSKCKCTGFQWYTLKLFLLVRMKKLPIWDISQNNPQLFQLLSSSLMDLFGQEWKMVAEDLKIFVKNSKKTKKKDQKWNLNYDSLYIKTYLPSFW